MTGDRKNRKVMRRDPHWIEWATGFFATLLVVAMIAMITYHGATSMQARADLTVTVTSGRTAPHGFEVSFIVANSGKLTAAGVPVTGRLMRGEEVVEEREITFDYVPAQSQAEGTLLFAKDPAAYDLDIRPSGYRDP